MMSLWKGWFSQKNHRTIYMGLIFTWISSVLFVLFSGGKLALILSAIITMITAYLILLEKWSGILDIEGQRETSLSGEKRRLETGSSLHVKIGFEIPGFWPITYVFVKDSLIHQQLGREVYESSFVPDFYRKGEITYTILQLKRGIYHFAETECSTGDIFNLMEHKSQLDLPDTFKVYPKTIQINKWYEADKWMKSVNHLGSSPYFQQETIDIDGVREYVHGDRLSQIHWKATAKTGVLRSKELERKTTSQILLVVDRHSKAYLNDEQFELAVSISSSIIQYNRREQIPMGLLSIGSDYCYFEPRKGNSYLHSLDEHLLQVNKDGIAEIHAVLADERLKLKTGTIVPLITPVSSEKLFQYMLWMKKRDIQPVHIRVTTTDDDLSKEWGHLLQGENIPVYNIGTLDDLPTVLGGVLT